MQSSNVVKIILFISTVMLIGLTKCDIYEEPEELWNSNIDFGDTVKIYNLIPADSAIGGVNEITIKGENFCSDKDSVKIYYNNREVRNIKSVSNDEIVFYRPNIYASSAEIKVVILGKFFVAKFSPYKITQVISEFGDLRDVIENITGLAVDANNVLYVTSGKALYKVTNGAPPEEKIGDLARAVRGITDMKFGPDNKLYFAINSKKIYTLDVTDAHETEWTSTAENVAYFDFNEDGTIYGGSGKGLFKINPDGSSIPVGGYDKNYKFYSIKVHKGYVYLAIEYKGSETTIPTYAIWRNAIKEDGSLDTMEVYFKWSDSGEFVDNDFTAITFDLHDNLLIGIKSIANAGNTTDPFAIVHPDGTCEALYFDRSILIPTTDQFAWDKSGRYLYTNRGITLKIDPATDPADRPFRIFKIDMGY